MTPRQGHPDYAVDADRGSSSTPAKRARLLDTDAYVERADTRQGLRELDVMTGQMTSLTALEKDRERIFPRDRTAPAGHPPAHAANLQAAPTGLLEQQHGEWMDTGAAGTAGGADPFMAPVGKIHRPTQR